MSNKASTSHVASPNLRPEAISDEDLLRGFTLSLGASGRKEKTLRTYSDGIRMLSGFARGLGLPGLAEMDRNVVRHWLMSLHQKGNKPAGIYVRYRAVNRFFKWCVTEGERVDNPMDYVDPPKIPDDIQPHYTPMDIATVPTAIGRQTVHTLRDTAIILTLFDTGVPGAELAGMRVEDIDWHDLSILVTGKGSKQRRNCTTGPIIAEGLQHKSNSQSQKGPSHTGFLVMPGTERTREPGAPADLNQRTAAVCSGTTPRNHLCNPEREHHSESPALRMCKRFLMAVYATTSPFSNLRIYKRLGRLNLVDDPTRRPAWV